MKQRQLMSGNEAVARGAWEGGCHFVSSYPGTPSTEITETLLKYPEIYTEWAVNEKVALESCIGASSFMGARSLTAMKHVGLNVAADPMFSLGYIGVKGGLVIISCDDPGMWSSQTEQDNRHYARHAKIPTLEPSDSNEAKDFTKLAFEISENYDTAIILRLTTRISHSSSIVTLGIRHGVSIKGYKKNTQKNLILPAHARILHQNVEKKLKRLAQFSEQFHYNKIEWKNQKIGIITSGISYMYAKEVFPDASFLKLSFTYPLPTKLIRKFANGVKKIFVIEEGDPILEEEIKALGIKVIGKDKIPLCGELSPEIIKKSFNLPIFKPALQFNNIPSRPPVLCPGCPERPIFYVLKKLGLTATGDIGCYTLGAEYPLNALDTCVCMGASITNAYGMYKIATKIKDNKTKDKLVAVIGDSTFFHSGISGLINAVYNRSNLKIIVLDNLATAMTGQQPNPGSGFLANGEVGQRIKIENVIRGCGVKFVKVITSQKLKRIESAIKELLAYDGVGVLIFRSPCIFLKSNNNYRNIDPRKCKRCGLCLNIGCPAISLQKNKKQNRNVSVIDANLCCGCDLCVQQCPYGAISKKRFKK